MEGERADLSRTVEKRRSENGPGGLIAAVELEWVTFRFEWVT
jgi:hypothetical protein